MPRRLFVVTTLLVSSSLFAAERNSIILNDRGSEIEAISQEIGRTVLRFSLDRIDYEKESSGGTDQYRLALPDEFEQSRGVIPGPHGAALPTITRLIAVPFDSDPQLRVINSHSVSIENIVLAPNDDRLAGNERDDDTNPREFVTGEIAGVMRDLRLFAVTVAPVRYDPEATRIEVFDEIEIEIDHAGSQLTRYDRLSEAFAPIYRSLVDNPALFDPIKITRGAYWVIFADTFRSNIMSLCDWKKAKGFDVVPITKTEIGANTPANIKNYIRTRFDSCQVKPDYVAIVGDVSMPSGRGIATYLYGGIASDNFYSFLSGNDYFPEVLIGRITVDNANDIARYLAKLLTYERPPDPSDIAWLRRAVTVASREEEDERSTHRTKLLCREWMLDAGFTQVDTLFVHYDENDPTAADIRAAIDAGVGYVNRRTWGSSEGWWMPNFYIEDILLLNNAPHFPIMTSIGEGTGDINDATCLGSAWIRADNKGGAGFIGNTNHFSHTLYDNPMDIGIFWGLFHEGVTTLAQAELMGKMAVYNTFPTKRNPSDQVELYFNSYHVIGDPEINCWTGTPREMGFIHADSIPFGQNFVGVRVTDEMNAPLECAAVCLWKGDEIFATGITGPDGILQFEVSAASPGAMLATVTAHGFVPRQDTIAFFAGALVVSYSDHFISDDDSGESSGDGDGIVNPAETIELWLGLHNFSEQYIAEGIACVLSSPSPFVEVLRDTASFPDILPEDSDYCWTPYLIRVSGDAPDHAEPALVLDIRDINGRSWQGIAALTIEAPEFAIELAGVFDDNGNGRLDPGEMAYLQISARNTGSKGITGATGTLRSPDPRVRIIDSTAVFGDCPPGAVFTSPADDLRIAVAPRTYPGHLLNFELEFSGQRLLSSTASFSKTVGLVTAHDPVGPDGYGYYCFDNTDYTHPDYPTYEWVNIDTAQWPFEVLAEDEEGVEIIPLPFTVRFYGEAFDAVSLCNNGFVALGAEWWNSPNNTTIPSLQCAPAMIAPLWDDFSGPLRIHYFHDTAFSRFIIGWRNARNEDNGQNYTFEIIILDEAAYPTATDDNEIIFQYSGNANPSTSSVGICSPDRRNGIGYVADGRYSDGAAPLGPGRALKFTTGRPTGSCQYLPGDINSDGVTNGLDIVYAVRYFRGGAPPPYSCDCPFYGMLYAAGDVNADCAFNGLDMTYLVLYFKGGAPLMPCGNCPPQPAPAR